jgi:hypothetical protein
MANLIEACDWLLGPAPRRFGFWERRRLCAVRKPWWLRFRRDDLLHRQYADMPRLLREGFLTWGRIIHSNNALADEGREDCPAEVLYSMLPLRQVDVDILDATGSRLFDLKGTQPSDPDTRALAEHLTAEVTRRFGLRVPRELSDGMPCRCSSLMVFRRHLPLGILVDNIVPLLVPPEEPYCVMILPSRFWPEPFVEHWTRSLAVRRLAHWGM